MEKDYGHGQICEGRTVSNIMVGTQPEHVKVFIIKFDDDTAFVVETCQGLTTASFIEGGE